MWWLSVSARECVETHYLKNPNLSVSDLARLCGVHKSTVSRILQKIRSEAQREVEKLKEALERPEIAEMIERELEKRRGARGRSAEEGETRERVRFVGTGISEVLKELGKDYAETVRILSEKRSWFTSVLVDLGFESMLMAFQYAKIDPKDILRKVEEFDDPDKFKEFVRRHLAAMIEASADAVSAILERDKRIRQLENALKVASAIAAGLRKTVEDLTLKLNVAEALISRYGLQDEYVSALMQANIVHALTKIPFEAPQAQVAQGKEEGGG
jgi:transcriptional regulator with XRE-family HTH domain